MVTNVRVEPDCGQASDSAQAGFEPATDDNVMGARSCLCVRALSAQKFIALLDRHFDAPGVMGKKRGVTHGKPRVLLPDSTDPIT